MSTTRRVVGIFAGGGSLPREIAEHVVARGGAVHIVALEGEADADFSAFPHDLGALGRDRRAWCARSRAPAASELVIVGSVRRPNLSTVRPDLGFCSTCRRCCASSRRRRRRRAHAAWCGSSKGRASPSLSPARGRARAAGRRGPLGAVRVAGERHGGRGARLRRWCARSAPIDVGQAVVVAEAGASRRSKMPAARTRCWPGGRAAARVRQARGQAARACSSSVPKPRQELRVDLPAIGPDTAKRAIEAGPCRHRRAGRAARSPPSGAGS